MKELIDRKNYEVTGDEGRMTSDEGRMTEC